MTNDDTVNGPAILVHKLNEPGALRIGSTTGIILSAPDERPDWAEGLAVAQVAERANFYLSRLGKLPNDTDGLIAFEDLGWVAIDAEGEGIELEADSEYRMSAIAEALGVNRSADLSSTALDNTDGELAHVVTSASFGGTSEEHAIEQAQQADFDEATGTK